LQQIKGFQEIPPNLQLAEAQTEGPNAPETIWKFFFANLTSINL